MRRELEVNSAGGTGTVPEPRGRVPLTILAGFLGAGKTSLLTHLLSADHGRRMAVLVNDFGAVNVDAQLIVNVEGETVSLSNGCICCTIRADLLTEVLRLLESGERFDHIVIETSGVSDPTLVAQTFLLPELQGVVEVDAILTLVDASEFLNLPEDHQELARRQVQVADLLLINKVDLATPRERHELAERLVGIAPQARLIETTYGRAPLELILGTGAAEAGGEVAEKKWPEKKCLVPLDVRVLGPVATAHAIDGDSNEHGLTFQTWSYSTRRPMSFLALRKALEELPVDIYRAKGWVQVEQLPRERGVFQMTGRRAWLRLGETWDAGEPETHLTFIGRPNATDTTSLAALFDGCVTELSGRSPGDVGEPVAVKDHRALSVMFS